LIQKNFMDELQNAKEELKEEIQENEGNDIEE
jgi:flagellar biosynthesis protein FlhB